MYKRQLQNNDMSDGQSFYEDLREPEPNNQEIILIKDQQKIQKYFIANEKFITEDQFVLVDPITKQYQMLCLTNYRIMVKKQYVQSIPYGYIQQFKPLQRFLRLILKTGIYLDLYLDTNQDRLEYYLEKALNLVPFCFICESQRQLPCIYDSYAEIQRMRVDSRLYSVFKNVASKFCSTYPLYFLVPKGVEVSNLNQVKRCRYMARIPILSFYSEKTNVGIWRAAKRKQDLTQQIKKYDVYYIRSIPGNLIVLEIEENSLTKSNSSFQSLQNLRLTYFSLTKTYYSSIQSVTGPKTQLYRILNKWYDQIDKLISLAYYAVQFINQGQQVLLEENYGLDRVSQVLVLAEIIMDPFFRTFDGLSIIIEKQFVSYGHPFEERCGLNSKKQQQISPIFIQLLECIHQLVVTHPFCFEYNSLYLAEIAYEVFTTKFKNFMNKIAGDPQKQRNYNKCCMGLWESLSLKRKSNPQYDKRTKKQLWEIRKKPSIKQFMIWVEYYDTISRMSGESH